MSSTPPSSSLLPPEVVAELTQFLEPGEEVVDALRSASGPSGRAGEVWLILTSRSLFFHTCEQGQRPVTAQLARPDLGLVRYEQTAQGVTLSFVAARRQGSLNQVGFTRAQQPQVNRFCEQLAHSIPFEVVQGGERTRVEPGTAGRPTGPTVPAAAGGSGSSPGGVRGPVGSPPTGPAGVPGWLSAREREERAAASAAAALAAAAAAAAHTGVPAQPVAPPLSKGPGDSLSTEPRSAGVRLADVRLAPAPLSAAVVAGTPIGSASGVEPAVASPRGGGSPECALNGASPSGVSGPAPAVEAAAGLRPGTLPHVLLATLVALLVGWLWYRLFAALDERA